MLPAWSAEALGHARSKGLEITLVAYCMNDKPTTTFEHPFFRVLERWTRCAVPALEKVDVSLALDHGIPSVRFDSVWDGTAQRIPEKVHGELARADVVIKLGMGLLRDPDSLPVASGVLSYHHGDPERHRGGPPGFYELLTGEAVQGVCVQRLSSTPGGGEILARATVPTAPHSYAETLQRVYVAGVPLLAAACEALQAGESKPVSVLGPVERPPSPGRVAGVVGKVTVGKVNRWARLALKEEMWQVGFRPGRLSLSGQVVVSRDELRPVAPPEGYLFAADPTVAPDGRTLLCEVLNERSGRGEIWTFRAGEWRPISGWPFEGRHSSYPQAIVDGGRNLILAETASAGPPTMIDVGERWDSARRALPLEGLEHARLVDPTPFRKDEVLYLFAGHPSSSYFRLDLWVAKRLTGTWTKHPASPVCMDVRGARMAGPVARLDGQLMRFGQDNAERYGDGIIIHKITELSPTTYREEVVGELRMADAFGPHTLALVEEGAWLDWYDVKSSSGAGLRRVRRRFLRKPPVSLDLLGDPAGLESIDAL